jgi:hypothetical protein
MPGFGWRHLGSLRAKASNTVPQIIAAKGHNSSVSLYSILSSSGKTAYTAASNNSFFAVSLSDWNAVILALGNTNKLGPSDANFTGASGAAFSSNYLFTADQSLATVPANNYIIGFRATTDYANQQYKIYGGPTFKSTSPAYSQIATTSPSTGASPGTGTYYYLRKAPTVQSNTTYIAILGTANLTMTANASYPTGSSAYSQSPFTSWTSWTDRLPKLQILITPTAVT